MSQNISTDRRSRKLRRRKSYRPIAEKLEDRRLLAAGPDSFVDNNNNGTFESGTDVVVNAEVLDGRFDTRVAEDGYVPDPAMYPNAGLYIAFSAGKFSGTLSGDQEVPAVATAATGNTTLTFDASTGLFDIDVFVEGIPLADISMAHIHAESAGVNGPVIFDLLAAGSFVTDGTGVRLTLTGQTFPAANVDDLLNGDTYVNVHTPTNTGGEVRGQLLPLISVRGDISYRANGDLTVNTHLTAGNDVKLVSRNGSVLLDDPTITADDDIEIEAELDIVSTDDVLDAGSEIELEAGRDILLFGTSVTAVREVELEAGGMIDVGDSNNNEGSITASHPSKGDVELEAEGDINVSDATIDAGDDIELESDGGAIIANNAMIGASTTLTPDEVELKASGDISADMATIYASKEVELKSKRGSIVAPNSMIGTMNTREVELKAAVDIIVDNSQLLASRDIELKARGGMISAVDAIMQAMGSRKADIELKATGNIDVSGATISAMDEIELDSKRGSIDAMNSMVTAGDDIELEASLDIILTGWTPVAGDDIELDAGGMVINT